MTVTPVTAAASFITTTAVTLEDLQHCTLVITSDLITTSTTAKLQHSTTDTTTEIQQQEFTTIILHQR